MNASTTAPLPYRYRSADDAVDLFAHIHPADGPPLLLMHGLTRNGDDFDPLVPRLAGPYRLIVPDQRGRGRSGHDPDPSRYRPDVYAADMFRLLDNLGIDRVALIGTSMGGLMAMLMAFQAPERVAAIVLNDIGPELDPVGLRRIQGYVGPAKSFADWDEAADACAAINGTAFPDFGPADWLAFARRTCGMERDGRIAFAYDPAIADSIGGDTPGTVPPDLWPLWDALSATPTLVVRGALSDLLAPATVAEMARRHDGPFVAQDVPRRGHAPLLDEPEALAAINPFLSRWWPA